MKEHLFFFLMLVIGIITTVTGAQNDYQPMLWVGITFSVYDVIMWIFTIYEKNKQQTKC